MAAVLVQVPYALGRRDEGLATGVPVLAEALADELGARTVVVEPEELSWNEAGASFDVVRASYEPVYDPEGRVPAAAVTIARQLVGAGVAA
jgi:hypothetical protein